MSKRLPGVSNWVDLETFHAVIDNTDVAGPALTLLLVMCRHLNANRECWASVRELASDCHVSERAIQDARAKLVEKKVLIPIHSGGSGKHEDTNGFRISTEPVQESSPVKDVAPVQNSSPVKNSSQTGEDLRSQPVKNSAPPSIRKLIKGENIKASSSVPPPPTRPPAAEEAAADTPSKKIFKIWTEERGNLQPCAKLTGELASLAAGLARAHPPESVFLEHFRLSVRIGSQLPFLNKQGKKAWRADLRWFVRQDKGKQHNFLRVLEGEFDDTQVDGYSPHRDTRGKFRNAEHYCPVCRQMWDCSGCTAADVISRCELCRIRILRMLDPDQLPLGDIWKIAVSEILVRIDPQLPLNFDDEFWRRSRALTFEGGVLKVAVPANYAEDRHGGSPELIRECVRDAGVSAEQVVFVPAKEETAKGESANPEDVALWNRILSRLKARVNAQNYNTWFKPTEPIKRDSRAFYVRVPNAFFQDWLNDHLDVILESARLEGVGAVVFLTQTATRTRAAPA